MSSAKFCAPTFYLSYLNNTTLRPTVLFLILTYLTSIRRVFGACFFFNPQLWGWLQRVVGVLHPSYYDHKSSLGGYYKCRWVWCKSAIYTLQRSLVRTSREGTSSVPSCREENPGYRHTAFFVFGHRSAPQHLSNLSMLRSQSVGVGEGQAAKPRHTI